LKERVAGLEERVRGGEMIMDGRVVGSHEGYPFFTVGQRRGLGVAFGEPVYVTTVDAGRNRVELGRADGLLARGLIASQVNLIKHADLSPGLRVVARIRYKDGGASALARTLEDGSLEVVFDEPKRAITPGQSVVLYEGDDVVGGGVIDRSLGAA
jgi:tRNA-specific 2-thiouridylase